MAIDNFIPELWAAGVLRNLHLNQVFAQPGVCNRDYEGLIKAQGDTVRITSIGKVTVFDYTKNVDLTAAEQLQDSQTTLTIEKQKAFNFGVSDVDQIQGNPRVMGEAMYEAAYALSNVQDQYIAGFYSEVASANMLGSDASPKTISAVTDVYNYLVDLKVKLDEANVPTQGRWCIVPPWFEGNMLKDDRFTRSFDPTLFGTLKNGWVARAAGFDILLSNNVTASGSNYRILAGHPMGITFAEQVLKMEAYRPPLRFDDAVKGLNLYGAKVVRPQALALLTITKA